MASQLPGEGEGAEQPQQASLILTLLRIDLRVGSLEIAVGEDRRSSMSRTRDIDHVEVELADHPVEVDPGKRLAGIGAPVSQEPVLGVLRAKRLSEQGIVAEVD